VTPDRFAYAAAVAWLLSWMAAAWWSKPTARARGGFGLYGVPAVLGSLMVYGPRPSASSAAPQLWNLTPPVAWAFAGVTVAGIAFAWWARVHLGALWSARTVTKADHRIVDTGPYGLVRHPIYTGILLMALGRVGTRGDLVAAIGWALLLLGFWMKARREERFLGEQLGLAAYADYARRVKMLVPFLV
jgi:protein-S-isoprenylcysteine O-methyltransferase Ste14